MSDSTALIILFAWYFAPTIIAFSRQHQRKRAVCLWSLLLGWTGIVWLACLFWSLSSNTRDDQSIHPFRERVLIAFATVAIFFLPFLVFGFYASKPPESSTSAPVAAVEQPKTVAPYVPASTVASHSASDSDVCIATMEKFNKVGPGHSYGYVSNVLGCDGERVSDARVEGYRSFTILWTGRRSGSSMVATFDNGRMVVKTQMGLTAY